MMASKGAADSDQKAKLPPATPVYVLRGHASPIHALEFYAQNSRLISGDADGWIVVWDMATKRPAAAWKAHDAAVLGVRGVAYPRADVDGGIERRIFTHGRDHALRIWRLNTQDEEFLDKTLPVDEKTSSVGKTNEPWLFHSLAVNALNFCPFDLCCGPPKAQPITDANSERSPASDMFVAVPNALNTGGIDIFHLPSERRVSTISPDPSINTGMVMTVNLFFSPDGDLCVVSGYEDGRAIVHVSRAPGPNERNADWIWECVYANQAHSQPILSLGIRPTGRDYFLTSSADALLVKHPLPLSLAHLSKQHGDSSGSGFRPLKVMNTKHAGQQGLRIRSDDKIFVTAGWDSRIRVYSCKTMKELAVLKWHKDGCYAISLADVNVAFELDDAASAQGALAQDVEEPPSEAHSESKVVAINPEVAPALATIKLQRSQKAQLTHWIAAGSKDGKISLWDIY